MTYKLITEEELRQVISAIPTHYANVHQKVALATLRAVMEREGPKRVDFKSLPAGEQGVAFVGLPPALYTLPDEDKK